MNIYGILTGLGVVLILVTADRVLKGKIKAVDFLFIILCMLFFSRLLAAILYHGTYNLSIADWLDVTNGRTPVIWGQLFGLGLATFFVSKIQKIKQLKITDALLLNYPIATSFVRLGNFFNQELYGKPTEALWAIYIKPEKRVCEYSSHSFFHPTFAYEIILNILNWVLLLHLRKKYRLSTGLITGVFMINYGIIRFIVNRFRLDLAFFHNIEVHDIFTIALSTLGFILLIRFVFSKQTQKNVARIVSKLFNHSFVIFIPLLIIIYQQSLFKVEPFYIVIILVAVLLGLIYQNHSFKILNLKNNWKTPISGIIFLTIFLFSLFSVSPELKLLTLSLTIVAFLLGITSTQWKISENLTYLAWTLAAIYLLTQNPLLIVLSIPLILLTSWSCLKLKLHDIPQIISGIILGIVIIVVLSFLTNSFFPL